MAESNADKPFQDLRAFLRGKREEVGKRQEDVGDAVGLSHSVISKWENPTTIIPDTLPQILRGYYAETDATRQEVMALALVEFQAWLDGVPGDAYRNGDHE